MVIVREVTDPVVTALVVMAAPAVMVQEDMAQALVGTDQAQVATDQAQVAMDQVREVTALDRVALGKFVEGK